MPIPRRSFYFLRHGQTDWNLQGRFQGHSDIPLNPRGLEQAHAAARLLENCSIDVIITSPLVRALKTAAIIAEALDKPLFVDSGLKERHFGSFEGLVVNDVKRQLGVAPTERLVKQLPPDAEQWDETRARTVRVVGFDRCADQPLLFVAHSGLLDALHDLIFDRRLEPEHAPYCWQAGPDGWRCDLLSSLDAAASVSVPEIKSTR